ncbi:MAG: hypothetical protein GY830_04025, partial [Bacteroidetes bacterium]|nr:hypothetical protein [Bacteroidota bacterium]
GQNQGGNQKQGAVVIPGQNQGGNQKQGAVVIPGQNQGGNQKQGAVVKPGQNQGGNQKQEKKETKERSGKLAKINNIKNISTQKLTNMFGEGYKYIASCFQGTDILKKLKYEVGVIKINLDKNNFEISSKIDEKNTDIKKLFNSCDKKLIKAQKQIKTIENKPDFDKELRTALNELIKTYKNLQDERLKVNEKIVTEIKKIDINKYNGITSSVLENNRNTEDFTIKNPKYKEYVKKYESFKTEMNKISEKYKKRNKSLIDHEKELEEILGKLKNLEKDIDALITKLPPLPETTSDIPPNNDNSSAIKTEPTQQNEEKQNEINPDEQEQKTTKSENKKQNKKNKKSKKQKAKVLLHKSSIPDKPQYIENLDETGKYTFFILELQNLKDEKIDYKKSNIRYEIQDLKTRKNLENKEKLLAAVFGNEPKKLKGDYADLGHTKGSALKTILKNKEKSNNLIYFRYEAQETEEHVVKVIITINYTDKSQVILKKGMKVQKSEVEVENEK